MLLGALKEEKEEEEALQLHGDFLKPLHKPLVQFLSTFLFHMVLSALVVILQAESLPKQAFQKHHSANADPRAHFVPQAV